MKKGNGFTLIELIVVIVILSILAAFAIPKYMDIAKEARISVTEAMEGSVRAAAEMVHGISEAKKLPAGTTTVTIAPGTVVSIAANKYPTGTATGLAQAIADTSDFTMTTQSATTTVFELNGAPVPSNCSVTYTNPGTVGTVPTITILTSGG